MPTIYDEDQSVDSGNVADQEYRRLANATGGISNEEDSEFDKLTSPEHLGRKGRSGNLSGGRKSADATDESDSTSSQPKKNDSNGRSGWLSRGLATAKRRVGGPAGKLLKNKWVVGIGAGGAGLLVLLIIMILVLMSALKVPHLMENITSYRFARVFQRASMQNERTIGAKISLAVADSKTFNKYKDRYNSSKAKVLFDKTNKLVPNKVMANLETDNLSFNEESTRFGGKRLTSITINKTDVLKPKPSFGKSLIPGYKFVNDVKLSRQFVPQLNGAMRTNEVGVFVRGVVGDRYRKSLGISWIAWKTGQYSGKSSKEVARGIVRDSAAAEKTNRIPDASTDEIDKATKKVEEQREENLKNDKKVDESIKNKTGVLPDVRETVNNVGKDSIFKTGLGIANPLYAIAAPVCIIYDGSIYKAGASIDRNSQAEVKAYNHMSTVGDQIKDGTTVDPAIIRAYDDKLGPDINASAPIQVASGNSNPSTAGFSGPQKGAAEIYTAFDVVFGSAAGPANQIAEKVCPVATNVGVAVGVGIANLIATVLTLGTAPAAEEVGGQTVAQAAKFSIKLAAKRVLEKFALGNIRQTTSRATKYVVREGEKVTGLAATTILARMIVANRAALLSADGTERNNDAVMAVDSGADIESNELSRQQQFGAPMLKKDVIQTRAAATAYMKSVNDQKNVFERYFALSNPQSMFSKFGMTTYASLHSSILGSIASGLQSLTNPSFYWNKLLAAVAPGAQASKIDTGADYGNIQWGWTSEEVALATHRTYQMFENQRILDASGRENEIADKYGKCFSGDVTQGTLLQESDIVLDDDGNVTNEGTCSPKNLGPHNPDTGIGDLVFRWRLAQADNQDLDEKANLEEVTSSDQGTTTGGSELTVATLNILHSDGKPESSWGPRLERSMKALADNKVDVAGLQEVRGDQNAAISSGAHGSSAYDIYPSASSSANQNFSPNPIIWNRDRYTKVSASGMPFLYFHRSKDTAPIVRLRDKSTGQEFYVINIHHPADTRGEASAIRHDDALMNSAFIKNLGKEGLPIFFTGDFNNRYTVGGGNQPLNNQCENLTYVVLSNRSGLWDAYDAANGKTNVTCPTSAPDSGDVVDHIFLSRSITQVSYKNLHDHGQNVNGSDVHNTILAHVVIPGSSTGSNAGTSFRVSSYNVKVGAPDSWRVTASKVMKQNNFDVVGMQELEHDDDYRSMKAQLDDTYDLYPKTAGTERNALSARTIAYRRDKFEFVKADEITFNRMGSGRPQPAHAPVVWLEDKQTGQEIIVINTHNPAYGPNAHPDSGGPYNGNQQRYEAGLKYVAKLKELSSEGLPIFFTGDFNEADGLNPGMTYQNRAQNLNYCMMTATGIVKDTEHAFLNKPDSDYCTASSKARGGAIDRIYVSKDVQVKKFARITGNESTLGTDHNHVPYADVVVPRSGTSTGSTSGVSDSTNKITTVNNLRDAGEATGVIKKGLLYRSGSLSEISDKDAASLSKLLMGKNGTIIDLQSTKDRGYNRDKHIPDVSVVGPLGIPATLDYTNFVDNAVDRQGFSVALRQIANAGGPVLIHCHGGNDRTGWTVAMIMYVLGASDSQVMKEYTASPQVPDNGSWLYNGLNDVQKKFGTPGKKSYHDAVMKYLTTDMNKGGLGLSSQTLSDLRQGLAN